jgi:hypothetical protein
MSKRSQWGLGMAMVLAMHGAYGCDAPDDEIELERELVDEDAEDDSIDETVGPAAEAVALTTHDPDAAYPGFGVDIEVDGDDVVLDWTGVGGPLSVSIVWRSTEPTSLAGLVPGLLPPNATSLAVLVGTKTFVDEGAASRTQATPTYFYRVVTGLSLSTMVAKVSTPASPGFTKLGMCMLDMPTEASDLVGTLGDPARDVYVWDPTTQGWRWWGLDAGQPFGDIAIPFGAAPSVLFDDDVPAYVSMTGRVPTSEPSQVVQGPGLNLPVHGLLAAPTTAAAVFGQPGVIGVGYWHPPTQTQRWYYGNPGDESFAITPCMPLYVLRAAS